MHASLADVYGVGLLFVGRSGIGKSECVLDLVERGHRLVADDVVNVGFVRKGEFLVTVGGDGSVRLWDLERGEFAGVLWDGTGAVAGPPPWYDAATDTVWVHTSGRLLQIPMDPAVWIEKACDVVGRELHGHEWENHVPWGEPQQPACT